MSAEVCETAANDDGQDLKASMSHAWLLIQLVVLLFSQCLQEEVGSSAADTREPAISSVEQRDPCLFDSCAMLAVLCVVHAAPRLPTSTLCRSRAKI